ncbi:MAG: hypothetical protein ABIF09_05170, partial [Gemmatimonadota bacterium]
MESLFEERVREHPERTLFQEMEGSEARQWTYQAILRRLRTIAALFWSTQLQFRDARLDLRRTPNQHSGCGDGGTPGSPGGGPLPD